MDYLLWALAVLAVLTLAMFFGWRYASRRWSLPCPTAFAWMVDGRLVDKFAGTTRTLDALELRPGMTIVEIGPGPGRLLLPAARRVLPGGKAIGVELQQGMLDKLRRKLAKDDLGNVALIHGDASQAMLPAASADLIFLCTVLGEIPERAAAIRHCYQALKPQGRLAITEIIGDPHYQTQAKVKDLAASAGFELEKMTGNWRSYTATFRKV